MKSRLFHKAYSSLQPKYNSSIDNFRLGTFISYECVDPDVGKSKSIFFGFAKIFPKPETFQSIGLTKSNINTDVE